MPVTTVTLSARRDIVQQPILWRLDKLFRTVVNIRRARVTADFAEVSAAVEGSTDEVNQALDYLRTLGLLNGEPAKDPGAIVAPEDTVPQPNTIYDAQRHFPVIHRIGRDFNIVVNIERAEFDEDEGGSVDLTLSGPLAEVQRAIAFLHTTGVHVNPRQRSVSDRGNL